MPISSSNTWNSKFNHIYARGEWSIYDLIECLYKGVRTETYIINIESIPSKSITIDTAISIKNALHSISNIRIRIISEFLSENEDVIPAFISLLDGIPIRVIEIVGTVTNNILRELIYAAPNAEFKINRGVPTELLCFLRTPTTIYVEGNPLNFTEFTSQLTRLCTTTTTTELNISSGVTEKTWKFILCDLTRIPDCTILTINFDSFTDTLPITARRDILNTVYYVHVRALDIKFRTLHLPIIFQSDWENEKKTKELLENESIDTRKISGMENVKSLMNPLSIKIFLYLKSCAF